LRAQEAKNNRPAGAPQGRTALSLRLGAAPNNLSMQMNGSEPTR
jgi:hypothetical protein